MTKKILSAVKKAIISGGAVTALVVTVGVCSIVAHADTAGTVKSTNVNIRSSADAGSSAVGTANTGDKITIVEEKTGADGNTWYKVKTSSGTEGYIRSDFVTKGDSTATTTTETTTSVTSTDAKTAYVAGSSKVNIRKNASTTSDVVASAQGKSEVTIIGEATSTDGYKWYQIEFTANGSKMQGYIRSDLITFTAPAQTATETEIAGTLGEETTATETPAEENATEDTPVEEAAEVEEPVEETPASETASALTIIEPTEEPSVIPSDFKEVEVKIGEETMRAWANGDFYILYGYEQGSNPQWYVYNYKDGQYLACEGLFTEGAKASAGATSNIVKVLLVVLIALVVILAIIVAVLAFKLANNDGYDDYDDFDDYDDDYVKPAKKTKEKKEKKKKEKKSKAKRNDYYDDDDDEYFDDEDFYDEEPKAKSVVEPEPEPTYANPYFHEGPVTSRVQTVTPQSNPYLQPEQPVYEEPVYVAPQPSYVEPEYVAPQPSYVAPQPSVAKTVEPEFEDVYFDDEDEEEYVPKKSKKDKKDKKEKKSKKGGFGKKFLDYFTVEVDEDDDDYDEYDDEYDDDDDMDFIDV